MPSRSVVILIAACAWTGLQAHDVISTKITWSQEVSRIVYAHCAACHREGGPAPMALLTYQQARPWAKAIKEEIHERRMPPWGAMKGFGEFLGDDSLTAEEMHVVADWVEGGAPEGDSQYLPPVPPAAVVSARQPQGRLVSNGYRLLAPALLRSISPPPGLPKGDSLQSVAVLPDGATLPLLWLFNFQPAHAQAFTFREPVRLPAGAVLRISGAGKVRLWP